MGQEGGLLEGERRLDLSGTDFYLFFFSNVVFAHPCASIDLFLNISSYLTIIFVPLFLYLLHD